MEKDENQICEITGNYFKIIKMFNIYISIVLQMKVAQSSSLLSKYCKSKIFDI